ncbi:VWFA and cache domain-containing protein 1 isoform X2 [Nematostella vectensis]|nr:VWFA and cache domain-containing protein 1 isoform X2 [Nematostella vectensis]
MKLGLDMRLLVLGLCGCFVLVLGHTNTQNCNMQLLASQVSAQLHATFESNLHAAKLQTLYQNVEFSNAPSTNPHDILQAIARGIEHKFNETINALLNAKTALTNTGASNTRIIECCAMPAIARANYSYRFRAMLNTSVACKTRNPKDSGIIQGENSLVKTFRNNLVDSSVISWQYFGTSTGNYLQFPASGKVCNGSSSFDPRFQSWYVEAVTRMRTNIVVVIDRSSSMSTAGRMALARQAAVTVLDTLGPNDKVGVVAFSHFIIKPPGCFGGNVAEALPKNINRIKAWVEALTPRGATMYVPALEAAFKMLAGVSQSSNSRRSAENMILFLTDGDPFDRNPDVSIFEAIRIGQRKLAFPARINVYGLGESLNIDNLNRLKRIASLNNGTFTQINDQDASSLSTIMGKYYTSTAKTREDSPAISVPHLIKDLGLVVTLSLAVKSRHGNVSGVVAVDAPLDTLMKEVVHFSTTGLPYAIVVDNKGRTLLHPNAPAPTDHLTAPTFQPLTLYEPFLTPDMYINITSGTPGSERIQTSILLSRGDPLTDGVTKVVINATYTWQPVRGGVYTIILVTSDRMDARFLEKATVLLSTVHSYYHRLDLSWQNTALSRTPSVCRTDGNLIAPLSSTVKIAPEAFNDSARYVNTPETQHDVEAIERFFNDLSQQVKYSDLSEQARVDVLLTAQLENQWNESRHRDPDTVKWRYIGTEGGVFRVFPGLRMNKTYSHKRQPWYRRAIANAGRLTVSRASLGTHLRHHGNAMISVGKTFTSKRSDWMVTEPVAGVTGLDMTIDAFREMLDYTRERCAIDSQDCYIMDDSGFLVVDIRARSLVVSRHVTGVFPWLAVKLTSVAGLVEPQWCNNLEDLRSQLYYTIHLPLNSSKSAPNAEPCRQFSLDLVPHTNVFLLSVTSRDGLVCNESPDPSCRCQVACTSCTGQVNPCQCPCSCKMKYDECTNSITGLWTGTPCPAPLPPLFDTAVGRQLKLEALRAVAPCPKPCYTLTTESDCNTSTSCHWCSSAATPKCSPVCRTNERLTLKVLYPCNDFLYLTPSQQGEVLQAFRDILYRNITKLTAKGLGTTTLTSE